MCKVLSAGLIFCLSVVAVSQTTNPAPNTIKDSYHIIEVNPFEIQQGVQLPADYFAALPDELVKQLQASHQFEAVLTRDQQAPTAGASVLRLTGVVTRYNEGSRAKRYLAYGAGAAQIIAHVKYLDRATGETVIEGEVIGTLAGGLFGGNRKNVVPEFAKAVVTTTRLMMLKTPQSQSAQIATGGPAASSEPLSAPDAAPAERTTLDVTSGNFDAQQVALNDLASKGFRLVGYASTGNKSATLTLEKGTDSSQNRSYLLLHTKLVGNLQKDLNKAAADGYRLVPHTLAYLGGYFAIAEKSSTPSSVLYQYRAHQTVRLSSAENNIKEDQANGFVLIDTSQAPGELHLFVLEKQVDARLN